MIVSNYPNAQLNKLNKASSSFYSIMNIQIQYQLKKELKSLRLIHRKITVRGRTTYKIQKVI